MKALFTVLFTLLLGFVFGQNMMIYQPTGGANDGTDEGGLNGGKDTWANRFSPGTNDGANIYMAASPRSNCNPSDYKSYYQFDLSGLPASVDSVFFGVMHAPHTTYCYSNCNADFYFYYVTSIWNEMTLTQQNAPTEDTSAFYGPIAISFPNDYQNREYDITNAYNAWKSGAITNNGFVVYSPTVGCNNAAVTFTTHTSDDTASANRPYLRIYYPSQAGLEEDELQLSVYPNPFEDYIQVNLKAVDTYYFLDITGRKIVVQYDSSNMRFNTSLLKPGIYFLVTENNKRVNTTKVVKF